MSLSLARPCLPVGEDGGVPSVEGLCEEWGTEVTVQLRLGRVRVVRVVEAEVARGSSVLGVRDCDEAVVDGDDGRIGMALLAHGRRPAAHCHEPNRKPCSAPP